MWDCLSKYLKTMNKQPERLALTQDVYDKLSQYEKEHLYPEIKRDTHNVLVRFRYLY